MLTLPIKKKWYDMILSGEKKEEYREIKPYYETRFINLFGEKAFCPRPHWVSEQSEMPMQEIMFRNGYSKTSPSFIATCTLSIGTGREEWGAEKDKQYFVLTIHKIMEDKINPGCKVGTEAAG